MLPTTLKLHTFMPFLNRLKTMQKNSIAIFKWDENRHETNGGWWLSFLIVKMCWKLFQKSDY